MHFDTSHQRWVVGTLSYSRSQLARLFFWMLGGDFAWQLRERALGPIAQIMLRQAGASDFVVGTLIGSVPSGIGFFLGPIISVKSDRHRGPWGRRIPYILIPTPFIVLAMLALSRSQEIGNAIHRVIGAHGPSAAACQIAIFALLWIVLEIGIIVANSLFNALVNDVVPQVIIGRFFSLFRIMSLSAGAMFYFWLLAEVDAHFRAMLTIIAFIFGAGFTVMCLKVKEGNYPPPPPPSDASHGRLSPVISYLKECLTHPFFLWYFVATTLGNLSINPVNVFSIFHSESVGMSRQTYGTCVALSYVCSIVLSYPLGILADKIHPVRMGLATMLLYAGATGYGFAYGTTSKTFFVALLLHTVISGCFFTGTASIAQRLLPREKFAEIASAGGVISAVCFMVMPPILGGFVGYTHHNSRFVFALACGLALASTVAFAFLLRHYNALGGDAAYMAPESAPAIGDAFPVIPAEE